MLNKERKKKIKQEDTFPLPQINATVYLYKIRIELGRSLKINH